jgi:predicted HNH restriction endonuclease
MVVLWLDLSLSSVSKHNIWSYYGWVCRCCRLSVNTIYGRIMVGLLLLSFSKHNIWSYYGWICRCRLSVNTIYGRIMVGFVVVVVCQ